MNKFLETIYDMIEIITGKRPEEEKPKRARGKKGKFLADDPKTKDINEAWVGGKAPKKKMRKK
tara:strand:+ start:548 stop:736 length:189 start_codon:yes stop_codon:yes gene_type:complete